MSECLDRRMFLGRSLSIGAAGLIAPGLAIGQDADPKLIVRNRFPLDVETPVEAFGSFLTPNRLFYIRSHFGAPAVGLTDRWTLAIDGGVSTAKTYTIDDLAKLEQVTIPAVLQCSGNGRAFYTPSVPGSAWSRGAAGNAEWTGVRLADLLNRVKVVPGMAHVHLLNADGPPMPKTPAYLRSIPLDRAMLASTIVATRMNGEPLPVLHGGPVRLVVPGWSGNHWIKWLRGIRVAKDEAPGFYMQSGYKLPIKPLPPGVDAKPSEMRSITALNVKSLISRPLAGATLRSGPIEVRGVAWTGGEATLTRVEVSTGQAAWADASFEDPARPYAWRRWRISLDAAPGPLTIRARATDSTGATQPETSPWNKSGYLWNGHDVVACEVH